MSQSNVIAAQIGPEFEPAEQPPARATEAEFYPELDQAELDAVAGGGQLFNHNQGIADAGTIPEPAPGQVPASAVELDPELDQNELDAVAGGGILFNHNQGMADVATTSEQALSRPTNS